MRKVFWNKEWILYFIHTMTFNWSKNLNFRAKERFIWSIWRSTILDTASNIIAKLSLYNRSFMWSIWKDSQARHWLCQVQLVYNTSPLFVLCFAHGMVSCGGRRTDTLGIFWGSRCSDCQFQAMPGEAELLQRSQCTPLLLQPRTLLSVCCFPGNSWICLRNLSFWGVSSFNKGSHLTVSSHTL